MDFLSDDVSMGSLLRGMRVRIGCAARRAEPASSGITHSAEDWIGRRITSS
jgi:hypothetical protein